MPNATFDTLKFAKTLREAGVPAAQAEAEAGVLAEVFSINFRDVVTKDDLGHAVTNVETKIRETEQRLNVRIDQVKVELRETEQRLNAKIEGVRSDLNAKIDSVRNDLRETEQRLNAKIDLVRADLNGRIDQTNAKVDLVRTELGSKIDHLSSKHATDITYIKWILGFLVSLVLGIAVRLLLFPAR